MRRLGGDTPRAELAPLAAELALPVADDDEGGGGGEGAGIAPAVAELVRESSAANTGNSREPSTRAESGTQRAPAAAAAAVT